MEEVDNIKNRLVRIKNTHPNIYNLWNNYLEKKLDSLNLLIEECKIILESIENDNTLDLTHDNLVTILLLMSCLNYESDMT